MFYALFFAIFLCISQVIAAPPAINYIVETQTLKPQEKLVVKKRYIGTVRAEKFSLLYPESSGTIASIHVKPGQRVKKNALLISMKNDVEQKSLFHKKQALRSQASELERYRELYKTRDVTRSELEKLERSVWSAEAQLLEQEKTAGKVEIRAPFDGVVGVPRVVLGETVQTSSPIISILDGAFIVFINIPASRINEIKAGQTVYVNSKVSTISAVEKSIDPITHMGFATTVLKDCPTCIVGDSVFVDIVVHEKLNAILVNRNAIYYKNGKAHVVLLNKEADGKLKATVKEVSLGVLQDDLQEITGGLKPFDQIVIANPKRIPEGAQVTVAK